MDPVLILASSIVSIVMAFFQNIKEAQDESFKGTFYKKIKVMGRIISIQIGSVDACAE